MGRRQRVKEWPEGMVPGSKLNVGWMCANDKESGSLTDISIEYKDAQTYEVQIIDNATNTLKQFFSLSTFDECMLFIQDRYGCMDTFIYAGPDFVRER